MTKKQNARKTFFNINEVIIYNHLQSIKKLSEIAVTKLEDTKLMEACHLIANLKVSFYKENQTTNL